MKRLAIWFTRRQLRREYLAYLDLLDRSNAGRHITDQLPSVLRRKDRCNQLVARLRRLDPSCNLRGIQ